jgi:hypothetical protein
MLSPHKRSVVVAAVAMLSIGNAAVAQTPPGTSGSYSYDPKSGGRGSTISVRAKCLWGGSAQGVRFAFGVIYKVASDDGSIYRFGQEFIPAGDGTVNGTVTVPSDAYIGDYQATGSCRQQDASFFFDSGPYAVTGQEPPNQKPAPRPTDTTAAPTTLRPTPKPTATIRPRISSIPSSTQLAGDRVAGTAMTDASTSSTTPARKPTATRRRDGSPGRGNSALPLLVAAAASVAAGAVVLVMLRRRRRMVS